MENWRIVDAREMSNCKHLTLRVSLNFISIFFIADLEQ